MYVTKLERYKLKCEEYGHTVKNTITKKLILWNFWKLKIKLKTKKKEYLPLFSIRDIEQTLCHSRQRSKKHKRTKIGKNTTKLDQH